MGITTTITLAEVEDKTEVTIYQVGVPERFLGPEAGFAAMFDKLEALLDRWNDDRATLYSAGAASASSRTGTVGKRWNWWTRSRSARTASSSSRTARLKTSKGVRTVNGALPPGDLAKSRASRRMRRMFRELSGYIRGIQASVALAETG